MTQPGPVPGQQRDIRTVDPLACCPKCGSALYHLFGDRSSEDTGQTVKAVERTKPIVARFMRINEPPNYDPDAYQVVDKAVVSNQIQRECRSCKHTWKEEINRTVGGSEYR